MYPNMRAEIARKNLRLEDIVAKMKKKGFNLSVSMLSQKLNGKYPLYLDEAKALKAIVETDIPIEVLFSEEAS